MLPNSQNIIVGHLNFAIFAETYIFFMYFSKLYVIQQYSFQFAEQNVYVMVVCVSVCVNADVRMKFQYLCAGQSNSGITFS